LASEFKGTDIAQEYTSPSFGTKSRSFAIDIENATIGNKDAIKDPIIIISFFMIPPS